MSAEPTIIRVAADSRSTAVAGAIAGIIREGTQATVQAIGAGAVNQAVKAVATARSYLQEDGIGLSCTPSFSTVTLDSREQTAITLQLINHRLPFPINQSGTVIDQPPHPPTSGSAVVTRNQQGMKHEYRK